MIDLYAKTHELRPYQTAAIAHLREAMREHKRVVLQLATGAGKTIIASNIVQMALDKGRKVLFLAPRRELIDQAASAFERHGIRVGKIMAGRQRDDMADMQVASFDTLHARGIRKGSMRMPPADLIIVDEIHLAVADSRQEVLNAYPDARLIGLTATPARGDGRGLGELVTGMVFGPSITLLTSLGYLVPVRYYAPSKPDLAKLKLGKDGDYQESGLANRMDTPKLVGDIVDNWLRIAPDRRTVVFCVNCAHSLHLRDEFILRGIRAAHVDGETPHGERAEILEGTRSGKYQVLCNVFVASYGLDIPVLDCAVLARPTKNITLYLQTCGRVLRPWEGKSDALIIDHAGAVEENGFVDDEVPWSLDTVMKVKDLKKAALESSGKPKQMTCPCCTWVFGGSPKCPQCGYQMVPLGKAVPVHEADLQEVKREASKLNRHVTWDEKRQFFGMLRQYCAEHGKGNGLAAHRYRDKFGVWPNDDRVKGAPLTQPSEDVLNWLKSRNIAYAKRRPNA